MPILQDLFTSTGGSNWMTNTWSFAKKKIYLDLGDELFGVAWMSPDCKMIKGTHCEKKKFIAKLLA